MPTSAADLLTYEGRLRTARSVNEVEFLIVNEPFSLLQYDESFLWKPDVLGRPTLCAASGLAEVDANSPFALWFSRAATFIAGLKGDTPVRLLAEADFPAELNDGAEWIPAHVVVLLLRTPLGKPLGGLWFGRSTPFAEQEVAMLAWVGQHSEFVLWAWRREQLALQSRLAELAPKRWLALSRRAKSAVLATVFALLLFPVRQSVLAPAEVTPLTPSPVTAPVDGVVARILVKPNDVVRAGTPLVEMDDTATRNRLFVAQKTLDVAHADLARASGRSFGDDVAKAEVQLLASRVRERDAEATYLAELLARLHIAASAPGIALFTDAEDWRGKPVQVGERIMTIADPAKVSLTIYVAPGDALDLDRGAKASMYLDVSPLSSLDAEVIQASYETGMSPEGHPAYVVKATFVGVATPPRLGLKGTAKIYSSRVPLAYYLMRKPLRTMRHWIGF